MNKLCEKDRCTGCMACYNICNQEAIDIISDQQGFKYPQINTNKCIECNRCTQVCPIINPITASNLSQTVFSAWNKNSKIQDSSSSGGFFTAIAEWIIQQHGYIIGAAFDEKFNVNHIAINCKKDLYKLRGSKYLQSNINSIYKEVLQLIKEGKTILFTGTPCQIAGLKTFLHNKEYPNLYTIDLVCHGVPSPLIFQKYKSWLEQKYNSPIQEYYFRDKKWSWIRYNTKAIFKNGKIYYGTWEEDIFMRGFLRDLFLRSSCYNCQFTNTKRQGDITIADFWGYKKDKNEINNNDTGISLLILNTNKGKEAFESCKNQLVYYKKDLQEAIKGNNALTKSALIPINKNAFWDSFFNNGFQSVINDFLFPDPISLYNKSLYKYGKNSLKLKAIKTFIQIRTLMRRLKKHIIK